MTAAAKPASFYADFAGLTALKKSAVQQDPKALREAARQFESIFTQMMLKSMRSANQMGSSGDSLMDSDQSNFYRDLYDSQLSVQLAKGKGLGLADMLVRQLSNLGATRKTQITTSGVNGSPAVSTTPATVEHLQSATTTSSTINSSVSNSNNDAQPTELPVAASTGASATDASLSTSDAATDSTNAPLSVANPADFVRQMWPHAVAAARELGVDPHTLLAHAALETGWGKFIPCNADGSCSYNLFGIKAGGKWQGPSVGVNTLEYEGGVAVTRNASFRAYSSPADSFRDYATFLKNSPRYANALNTGNNATAFATALQQGGYATDPNYANKLAATAASLRQISRQVGLKTADARPLTLGRGAT